MRVSVSSFLSPLPFCDAPRAPQRQQASCPSASPLRRLPLRLSVLLGFICFTASQVRAASVPLLSSGIGAGATATLTSSTPRTYMGGVFNLGTAVGTTNVPLTGGTLYLVTGTAANYSHVQATVYFWGSASGAFDSNPAFSNLLGTYSHDYGSLNATGLNYYLLPFKLDTPILVPSGTVGVTVNWKGDTGSGLVDDNNLTSLLRYGPALPVGSLALGTSPSYGYYRNASGRTDGNFLGADLRTLSGGYANQSLAVELTTTVPGAPLVTTVAANTITTSNATIRASINPNDATTTAKFQYGTTDAYGNESTITLTPDNDGSAQPVNLVLTGLKANTTYHFRAKATNDLGTTDGSDLIFTTLDNPPSGITLSRNKIMEDAGSNVFIGQLSGTDPDVGDTLTYSLPTGVDNNDLFSISGNQLRALSSFDYEVQSGYLVTVRATDNHGLFFDQQFTINVVEATKPTVSILSPTVNQKVLVSNFNPTLVSGSATDNIGVTSVRVRLSRKRNNVNQYWNGTGFVLTQATVNADLMATANGMDLSSTTWALSTALPPADKLDSGAYAVQVSAYDAAGNKSDYAERTFNLSLDQVAPTLTITAPTAGAKVLFSDFVSGAAQGTASDDVTVAAVKVRLSRKSGTSNVYWNGTDFVAAQATVDADMSTTDNTWKLLTAAPSLEKLTPGAYSLSAYAIDGAGNKSATAATSFTLGSDFIAPSVAISTPTASQVVDINALGPGSISGIATDNLAVTSVKLKLQRSRGGMVSYWNGSEFTPTVATVDADYNSELGIWVLASTLPADKLDRGGYTLYATAYDGAGNKTTSASRVFSVVGTASAPGSFSATMASSASRS